MLSAVRASLARISEMSLGALAYDILAGPTFFHLTGGRASVTWGGVSIVAGFGP